MTNYAQICLIFTNCGRIYGQKWPDLWPNEIVGMAMAMVAIPDFTSMSSRQPQELLALNGCQYQMDLWIIGGSFIHFSKHQAQN